MDVTTLLIQQQSARARILEEFTSSPATAEERALAHADAREWRMLEAMNQAVFWGTLKAHLTLAVIGGVLWGLLAASVLR